MLLQKVLLVFILLINLRFILLNQQFLGLTLTTASVVISVIRLTLFSATIMSFLLLNWADVFKHLEIEAVLLILFCISIGLRSILVDIFFDREKIFAGVKGFCFDFWERNLSVEAHFSIFLLFSCLICKITIRRNFGNTRRFDEISSYSWYIFFNCQLFLAVFLVWWLLLNPNSLINFIINQRLLKKLIIIPRVLISVFQIIIEKILPRWRLLQPLADILVNQLLLRLFGRRPQVFELKIRRLIARCWWS